MDNYQIQQLVEALDRITAAVDNLTVSLEQARTEKTTDNFEFDFAELDRLRQAAVAAAAKK